MFLGRDLVCLTPGDRFSCQGIGLRYRVWPFSLLGRIGVMARFAMICRIKVESSRYRLSRIQGRPPQQDDAHGQDEAEGQAAIVMGAHPPVEQDAGLGPEGEQGEAPEEPAEYLPRIVTAQGEGGQGNEVGEAQKEGQGRLLLVGRPLGVGGDVEDDGWAAGAEGRAQGPGHHPQAKSPFPQPTRPGLATGKRDQGIGRQKDPQGTQHEGRGGAGQQVETHGCPHDITHQQHRYPVKADSLAQVQQILERDQGAEEGHQGHRCLQRQQQGQQRGRYQARSEPGQSLDQARQEGDAQNGQQEFQGRHGQART